MLGEFLAHSENINGSTQTVKEHIQNVARIAASFAVKLKLQDSAYNAGLLHDVGKYGTLFQQVLAGTAKGIDHSTPGAWLALTQLKDLAAGLAIYGHHIGLPQADPDSLQCWQPGRNTEQRAKLSEPNTFLLLERLQADGLSIVHKAPVAIEWGEDYSNIDAMLDTRMLMSCLVDADYRDTQAHFDDRILPEGDTLRAAEMLAVLEQHIEQLSARKFGSANVQAARQLLADDCADAASNVTGCYTLTSPTGTGKTLAMMRFALKHAVQNDLDRVIVVIPYLSIIEQTVRVYRELFNHTLGSGFLVEDHSLAKGAENRTTRTQAYLTESWDAPVVVTTSVQMLESLFANRPAQCRKLHNLANSVILFDEVQTLPPALAQATVSALRHLSERYHSSVVFSTATQPAFDQLSKSRDQRLYPTGWQPTEIVKSRDQLFEMTRRVSVEWPDQTQRIGWRALAEQISQFAQCLVIVNLKKQAHELVRELQLRCDNVMHLSTSMCVDHRNEVLQQVRYRLEQNLPITLVSTQCIEAGVDVDFPKVYRAMADLCSIAQAAGRCNRNGHQDNAIVEVFLPDEEKYPPSGGYRQAAEVCKVMVSELGHKQMDISDPKIYKEYYRRLYTVLNPTEMSTAKQLGEAINRVDFPSVAKEYQLITQDSISVLVPYASSDTDDTYQQLAQQARTSGVNAKWVRQARARSVQLYRNSLKTPAADFLEPLRVARTCEECEWYIYTEPEHYDNILGLNPPVESSLLLA